MIEQKIEKLVMDHYAAALSAAELSGVQIIGAWQPGDGVKAAEDPRVPGVVTVKVYPRNYETPTVPDAQFQVDSSVLFRTDVDGDGRLFLSCCDVLTGKQHRWQKSQDGYYGDFLLPGEFQPTGFQMAGGDVGIDKENGIWTQSSTFNLYGIVTD